MTPAIETARRAKIEFEILEYEHDPEADSYGEEAAMQLGVSPAAVFKTLVAAADTGELVVGVVPVAGMLSLKALARAAGCKKMRMADGGDVERATGYVLGGVSPLGQKRPLRTFIDDSATALPRIYVSAGRRGLELALAPADLQVLTGARFAPVAA